MLRVKMEMPWDFVLPVDSFSLYSFPQIPFTFYYFSFGFLSDLSVLRVKFFFLSLLIHMQSAENKLLRIIPYIHL